MNVKVMFLGGKLDHAVRAVPAARKDPTMPRDDTYIVPKPSRQAPWLVDHLRKAEPEEMFIYKRHRIAVDTKGVWYVFILDGHKPSTSDLLDACPIPL